MTNDEIQHPIEPAGSNIRSERRYDIHELVTTGWQVVNEPYVTNLTREGAQNRVHELIAEGYNPNDLKAVNVPAT